MAPAPTCTIPSPNAPMDPDICCTPADDNPPDECLNAMVPTPSKIETGTLTCNENFDCCSCSELVCNECVAVECSGDSSCIGVPNIEINDACVPPQQGAGVICGGDFSCFKTGISGNCIISLVCNGDNSCGESMFNFNTNPNVPVPDSFPALNLDFGGDDSAPGTTIIAENIAGITCGGDRSCPNTDFEIKCKTNNVDEGCKVSAGGDNAAENAIWDVNGADAVECVGDMACTNTTFDIDCISNGCTVTIGGEMTAEEARWDITNVDKFECASENGCSRGRFDLNCVDAGCPILCSSASCPRARFNVLNSNGVLCNGVILVNGVPSTGGCQGARFELQNNLGGSISCESTIVCKNAKFTNQLGGNIDNVESVKCASTEACKKALIQVNAANTDFGFECGGIGACKKVNAVIFTEFDFIKTISCDSEQSCKNGVFSISGSNVNGLIIESISFGGMRGGQESEFVIQSTVPVLQSISCGGERSCRDIRIVVNILPPGNNLILNLQCSALQSCVNAKLDIFIDGNLVNVPADINALDITIDCSTAGACTNAFISGVVPFF